MLPVGRQKYVQESEQPARPEKFTAAFASPCYVVAYAEDNPVGSKIAAEVMGEVFQRTLVP